MQPNIGERERLFRTIFGVFGILLGFLFIQGVVGTVLGIISAVSFVTGITGFCGIYKLLGISTRTPEEEAVQASEPKAEVEEAVGWEPEPQAEEPEAQETRWPEVQEPTASADEEQA